MKKLLAIALVVTMLASVFAIGASAVDNYTPKTIELVVNPDGETLSLPEGYVVYSGDTLIVPRNDIIFIGDYACKETGEVEESAMVYPKDVGVFRDGKKLGHSWVNEIIFSDTNRSKSCWFEAGVSLEAPGTYTLKMINGRDSGWSKTYSISKDLITFELKDPKAETEIVLPPTAGTTSTDTPPVAETSSVEETPSVAETSSVKEESKADTASKAETSSKAAASSTKPADTTPSDSNGALVWIIIAVVAVVAVVVVVVVVSKKKKK